MTKHFVADNPKVSTGVQTTAEVDQDDMCNKKQVCDYFVQGARNNSKLEQKDIISNKPLYEECPSGETCKNACCFEYDVSEIPLPTSASLTQRGTGQNLTKFSLCATKEVGNNSGPSGDGIHDIIASNLHRSGTTINDSPEVLSDEKHPERMSASDKKSPTSDWVPRRPAIHRSISEPHTGVNDKPTSSIIRPMWKPNTAVGTIHHPAMPGDPSGYPKTDDSTSNPSVQNRRAQFRSTFLHAKSLDSTCNYKTYCREDLLGMATSPVAKEINEEWIALNEKFPDVFNLKNPNYFDPDSYELSGRQLPTNRLTNIFKSIKWNPNSPVLDDNPMSRPV